MKKILSFVVLAVIMVSCYDDGELRNLISNTNQELANLTDRVEDIEDWQETVNAQVKALQDLVGKAEEGKVITNVQETSEGYVLTFSDESVITVKHGAAGANGTNGTNGIDGQTPAIGVKADEDGTYYWTINGEWLYAGDAKVKAQGADGKTPKLQINDGEWQVSYDNGSTWEGLGVYVSMGDSNEGSGGSAEGGKCLFQRVIPSETEVTFVFQDGSSFKIPVVAACKNLLLNFGENTTLAVAPGYSETLDFTVTGADGAVTVEFMVSETWTAELEMTAEAAGTFTIEAPADFVEGKLIVLAADEAGKMTMKTIKLLEGENPNLIFRDTFAWATGAVLLSNASGEKRWDSYTGTDRPAWTTTVYTGAYDKVAFEAAGGADAGAVESDYLIPALWMRNGCVRMNYAKKPSNLVTPKLSKIEGTKDLTVSFKACAFKNSAGEDGWHEIHVACFGPGEVSQDTFDVTNRNNTSESEPNWYTLGDAEYTFTVTGATSETQIEFHFGPRREAADYNTNVGTPATGNENCRMGFDDVVVMLAQ